MVTKVAFGLMLAAVAFADDGSFVFAGLSLTPEPWNKEANLAKLERYVRQAAAMGAQVVGFAERRQEKMYNSAVIFSPEGSVVLHYSKSHTADDEPFNTKGTEFPVASTQWGRWGMLICYDRQMPETARILSVKGAQLILVPAWGSYSELNDIMMRVRAYENGVWLAFVHPKRCLVIDPRGHIIAQNDGEQDQIVTAQISTAKVRRVLLERRRPEIYGEILSQAKEK